MADIKITSQIINEYRALIGNYVLSDSAISEMIKKDIETGKLPKEFATLATDAQKTVYNASSSNLFGYGFSKNDELGLSIVKTIIENNLSSNEDQLVNQDFSMPIKNINYEILSPNNKTISPVEYSDEINEKLLDTSTGNTLYLASDEKKYDIKEILTSRVENLYNFISKKSDNIFDKIKDKIVEFFNIENTYKIFEKSLCSSDELLYKTGDISELFLKLTGYEYKNENIEKFLLGEIKLKSEIAAEKYLEKNIEIISATPYISQYYISQNSLQELISSRKTLNKDEKKQYDIIKNLLPEEYQKKLANILSTGQLLQDNSEGNITILSSLYKIANKERSKEINNIQLLKDCIDILDNPYVITQGAEDIPEEYQDEFKNRFLTAEKIKEKTLKSNINAEISIGNNNEGEHEISDEAIFKYRLLGTCAAASVEFELATRQPAEFFRIIEGLSSKDKSVNKTIDLDKYDNHLLELFKTQHKIIDHEKNIVRLSADENAYLLSEIQNNYQDEGERSIVDILMQSVIMNLGSRQTYNSINDKRATNEFTNDNGGLIDFEVNFARKVLISKFSYNNRYKEFNPNGKFKDLYEQENIKNEILKTLQKNNNVVAGLIYTDDEGFCTEGHEITIVGYTKNIQGRGFFIIQDSDDFESKPVAIKEEDLLKSIHHAFL